VPCTLSGYGLCKSEEYGYEVEHENDDDNFYTFFLLFEFTLLPKKIFLCQAAKLLGLAPSNFAHA
jgi:hypothetical protein